MKKKGMILALVMTLLTGCSSGAAESAAPALADAEKETGAVIQDEAAVAATLAEVKEQRYQYGDNTPEYDRKFKEAYSRFALDMVNRTISPDDNYISSPLSVYCALAMLSNAAAGDTAEQMNEVLGLTPEELNKALYLLFVRTDHSVPEGQEQLADMYSQTTYFGNALWLNDGAGFEVNENYRNILQSYYGSDVIKEDFADKAAVVQHVNDWIAERTNHMLENVYSEDSLQDGTLFLLINSLAFEDRWFDEFEPSDNTDETFLNQDGSEVTTAMMHCTEMGWWHDEHAQGIFKPLRQGAEVVLILPEEGMSVYDYLAEMNPDTFRNLRGETVYTDNYTDTTYDEHYTDLTIPKFKYDADLDLGETLKEMGLTRIFESDANLSRMLAADYEQLFVSDKVIHKATVDLNEEGISAAAATIIGGLGSASDLRPIPVYHDLILDRPFIYAIVEAGVPLFIGVVSEMDGTILSGNASAGTPIGTVNVKVDGLRIRSNPGTWGEQTGTVSAGETRSVYETAEGEGYTWYRIGSHQWIADQDGAWLDYKPE
ncbi:MAG: hypothetical protein IKE06_02515 [Solobacterium sp.]|nr:hypothetical protein [Solobacterium sp.]